MLGAFWQSVGGKLADRWGAASGQALVFWLAGLSAWLVHPDGVSSVDEWNHWLSQLATTAQVAVLLAGLLSVAASAFVVTALANPVLRLAEGYWPAPAAPLRRRLVSLLSAQAEQDAKAWQDAYAAVKPPAVPTPDQLAIYSRLEHRRRRRPASPAYFMPTPVGNILRAAERRAFDKYGLDAVALWPRLWLLLPDLTRQELLAARASLDSTVTAAIWGLLFCAFTPITPLVIPIGLVISAAALIAILPRRAEAFGDLVEAAYDLYRAALYKQLRWPLPENPAHEYAQGQEVTAYLWRGSRDGVPAFKPQA